MDRLSSLPDIILLHILSFLTMHDILVTTRVSKQFHSLWPFSASLIFKHLYPNDFNSKKKFISFVDKCLLLLNTAIITTTTTTTTNPVHPLNRFHLDFSYESCFAAAITVWLIFIDAHKVKDVNLILTNKGKNGFAELYILPKRFGENPFFEKLNLDMCSFSNLRMIKWDALIELKLGSTMVNDDMVKMIVSGCPLLEIFELKNCYGFEKLDFDQTKLIKLVIDGSVEEEREFVPRLKISGPSIKYLEISGFLSKRVIELGNVSGVDKVKFDFFWSKMEGEAWVLEQFIFVSMFDSLLHVKDVTLNTWCVQALSSWGMEFRKFRLEDCKRLTLHAPIQEGCLPGILRLLQYTPHAETFVIQVDSSYFEFHFITDHNVGCIDKLGGTYWTSGVFRFGGPFLKHIEIIGFEGTRYGYESPFVQFLLRNSTELEKMVIRWNPRKRRMPYRVNEGNQLALSLLNFPRSSSRAEIIFVG